MLHGLLHGRSLIAAALAACSLVGLPPETARADDAQVTVVTAGGEQQTLSLDALGDGDVAERRYVLRSAEGESSATVNGFSPAAILAAAGVDPYAFSYLEVQRPAGGSVLLSRDQALDPDAFPDGPPVIHATATGTGFLRPSVGDDDLNATDSFDAPRGIALVLRNGSPLQVRAQASTVRTRPGRPVTFTAIVERAGAGERLSYSWYFDDGHSASGAGVRHRFSRRGSYDVVVGVTTPGDDAGASAVVTVQVGPPLAGPDRRGGGTNDDAGAPDHGAASGRGHRALSGGSSTATGQPRSTEVRSHLCSHSERKCDRNRAAARRRTGERRAEGARVSGLLIDGERAPAPPRPAAAPAARTGKLTEAGNGPGLPGAAVGLLAATCLLALGALIEARGSLVAVFVTKEPRL